MKIALILNAPAQTPVFQIAGLSAKLKGQEKRYIVSMSGADLSFIVWKSVSFRVLLLQYRMW